MRPRAVLVLLLATGLCATLIAKPLPRLVWNVSASMPTGLYAVAPGVALARGDTVLARLPPPVRALAARRRYLPADVPILKRVSGIPGDRICAQGDVIMVGGKIAAIRHAADGAGRALPWWRGCIRIGTGALFLLAAPPDSFDGRYFGASRTPDIIGRATPLWLR
jgi:conjugative transfer signal peptidase TraF